MKHLIYIIIGILTIACSPSEEKIKLNDNQISRLDSLKNSELYSDSEWDKRGLIPSEIEKVEQMKFFTNKCLDEIIENAKDYQTKTDYERVLKNGLNRFNKLHYDTEEKEFIADKFYEISLILDLDFIEQLNTWQYGKLMSVFQKLFNSNNNILRINEVNCTNCNEALKGLVTKEEENIPEFWIIIKCMNCGKYNLMHRQKNIKEVIFENCIFVKGFPANENDSAKVAGIMNEIE